MNLLSHQKIWAESPHCAFPDLIYFKGRWLVIFREAASHRTSKDSQLRIITSIDSIHWETITCFRQRGIDFRDPKLTTLETGKLMLLAEAIELDEEEKMITRQTVVSFSDDGKKWSHFIRVLSLGEWLWRLTWFKGTGYGVAYHLTDINDIWKRCQYKLPSVLLWH